MYNWDFFDDIPEYHPMEDANNLYTAFQKSRKGSHWKASVQRFRWNILSEIRKLQTELYNLHHGLHNAYKLSPYSRFFVNERGKTRAITALSIRDRVVKHVLNDVFLLPHLRRYLIYDNGASLEGKGVSFTRNRLVAHLKSFYREYGSNDGWIMIIDFSGYYDNIDHEQAMEMIVKYEPDDFARLLTKQAYDSYKVDVSYMTEKEYEYAKMNKFSTVEYRQENHSKEELCGERYLYKSLSVGDQTSQITAVSFPTPIDYLVTKVCGYKYYGRYMDDLYVIGNTKEQLLLLYKQICTKATELKLIINKNKTNICRLGTTFKFLQLKYFLTKEGYVVIRINPKAITRMRKKLKALRKMGINAEDVFKSWIGSYSRYMSKKQRTNIISLYSDLFGNNLDKQKIDKEII